MCQLQKWYTGSPIASWRMHTRFSSDKHMITGSYLVACPALGEREIVHSAEQAADICYSMHCESDSYAFVEDWLGWTYMEYGDPSN